VGEWGESLGQTLKNKNKIFYICNSSSWVIFKEKRKEKLQEKIEKKESRLLLLELKK